jgi:CRP/FNR family transcriptional regulator, cyclic AMP receptor protein
MSCSTEQISEIGLFALFSEEERRALAEVVQTVKLNPDQTLFQTGEPGDKLFIIKFGQVELSIKDTIGQKIVLSVPCDGDFFGEVSLLDDKPRTATAVALTDCELLVLSRTDLLQIFAEKPQTALRMLAALGDRLRQANKLLTANVARNVNEMMDNKLTALERAADWIAWFSGSLQFLLLNAVWFAVWISINTLPLGLPAFDPFPFGLLTMIVSLEAIFLSCFVLISQNRQAAKDHVRSDIEYDVNIKAEMEIAQLHEKTDRVYEEMLNKFAKLEKALKSENAKFL